MKELVINKKSNEKQIMLLENGELTEKYKENNSINRIEGNIYIGRVENVLQGMQSAFIDIGDKRNTFIRLKDLLPKEDETKISVDEKINKCNIKS